jgi:hypothetical protein
VLIRSQSETVATDGADPAFGERVRRRRAKRGADDLDAIQPRTRDLAAKHSQFVAEDDDLEFLELARPQPQRRDRKLTPE